MGIDAKTNEHVVALDDGGAAIRVRTIIRRPLTARWNPEKIQKIRARPRNPNPENADQPDVLPERLTRPVEVLEDGTQLIETSVTERHITRRDFYINKKVLEKHGYAPGCAGCEGSEHSSQR